MKRSRPAWCSILAFTVACASAGVAVAAGGAADALPPASDCRPTCRVPGEDGLSPLLVAADAPGSRDALFGDDTAPSQPVKPPADESREKLFGEETPAPRRAPAWGGFVRGEFAYTYGDPAHWSKLLLRSELDGEGALSDNVKYHVGARLDYDFDYDLIDF